jgi:hypothetical protein
MRLEIAVWVMHSFSAVALMLRSRASQSTVSRKRMFMAFLERWASVDHAGDCGARHW